MSINLVLVNFIYIINHVVIWVLMNQFALSDYWIPHTLSLYYNQNILHSTNLEFPDLPRLRKLTLSSKIVRECEFVLTMSVTVFLAPNWS